MGVEDITYTCAPKLYTLHPATLDPKVSPSLVLFPFDGHRDFGPGCGQTLEHLEPHYLAKGLAREWSHLNLNLNLNLNLIDLPKGLACQRD